jgi:hypothetical protein
VEKTSLFQSSKLNKPNNNNNNNSNKNNNNRKVYCCAKNSDIAISIWINGKSRKICRHVSSHINRSLAGCVGVKCIRNKN